MLDEFYIYVHCSVILLVWFSPSDFWLASRQRQASCSSYNSNVSKVQINECKQGAARVKGALKCWPCTKKCFNRAASQLLHFKNSHGPIQNHGATVRAGRETGTGLLVPQVRSNIFLRLQENNWEYKMQMYLYIWLLYWFFKINQQSHSLYCETSDITLRLYLGFQFIKISRALLLFIIQFEIFYNHK